MVKLALGLMLLLSTATGVAAQCCGDCNGDGVVTINELITAVNAALGSCAAPTPTPEHTSTPTKRPTATVTPANRCPFTFASNRGDLCTFNGTYNRGCGAALDSLISSNGSTLIVTIATMLDSPQFVYFSATVTSPTSANLTAWSTDNFQSANQTAGQVQLLQSGAQLVIFPNDPPFTILGCNFVQYTGTYTGSTASAGLAGTAH